MSAVVRPDELLTPRRRRGRRRGRRRRRRGRRRSEATVVYARSLNLPVVWGTCVVGEKIFQGPTDRWGPEIFDAPQTCEELT